MVFGMLELATRLHHWWRYEMFFPVKEHVVFYDYQFYKNLKKIQSKTAPMTNPEILSGADIILSGASVAYGFGLEPEQHPKRLLSQQMSLNVGLNAVPGQLLVDEINSLKRAGLKQGVEIVFVSGFNDCFLPKSQTNRIKLKAKLFTVLFPLRFSLLCHKLFNSAYKQWVRSMGEDKALELKWRKDTSSLLKKWISSLSDQKVIFFFQPYLNMEKKKTEKEEKIFKLYKRMLGESFVSRRKWLVSLLRELLKEKFIDLQPEFLGKEAYFSDVCHLTPLGNRRLIELIQKRLNN
jgi:hypothetical protein